MIKWYSQHSGWPKKIPAAWPWISQVARLFVAGDPRVIPGSPPGASSCVARIEMRTKHLRTFCVAIAYSCPELNSQPCLDSQRAKKLWVHQAWHPNNGPHSHKPLRALGTECHLTKGPLKLSQLRVNYVPGDTSTRERATLQCQWSYLLGSRGGRDW